MSLRLFVALDLPADVRSELAAWGRSAVERVEGARALAEESLHVTLCFLGSRSEEEAGRVADIVREHAATAAPLALGGALALPRRGPKVIAAEVEDPGGSLSRLHSVLEGALCGAGLHRPERRRFRPHVTVARLREGAAVDPRAVPAPPPVEPFAGAALTLYRSITAPSGARYEPLERVSASGGGAPAAS